MLVISSLIQILSLPERLRLQGVVQGVGVRLYPVVERHHSHGSLRLVLHEGQLLRVPPQQRRVGEVADAVRRHRVGVQRAPGVQLVRVSRRRRLLVVDFGVLHVDALGAQRGAEEQK